MYYFLALALMAAGSGAALLNWRLGLVCMIAVAAVQDPLRKLVPGTPGLLALITAPIFLAAVVNAVVSTRGWWQEFVRYCPRVAKPLLLMALLSVPAAVISATYGQGSWMLTILGAFSYSVIFLAVIAGFHFARRGIDIRLLLATYCVVHGVVLIGAYLEYFDLFSSWTILSDEAMGYDWVRHQHGYVVEFIAGFYRSGDVMGWHAAAVACLSATLAIGARGERRWVWILLSVFAIGALLMCGRRKMVYMLPVFAVTLMFMYWQGRRRLGLISMAVILAIPFAGLMLASNFLGGESNAIRYYTSTSDQTLDSIEQHGFESVAESVRQNGFFGAGLGTATPGSHHLDVERPRTWQESAPSRIVTELGVPGAVGLALVMLGILVSCWHFTRVSMRIRSPYGPYAAGMLSFFVANVGSLTVSGQILADPFIAAFLGIQVGLVLSIIRLPPDPFVSRNEFYADQEQAHAAQSASWGTR